MPAWTKYGSSSRPIRGEDASSWRSRVAPRGSGTRGGVWPRPTRDRERQAGGRLDQRPQPPATSRWCPWTRCIHRRGAEPDGRRFRRIDPLPGTRRRQPRFGLGSNMQRQSGAAIDHRAALGGHGHGDRNRQELQYAHPRSEQGKCRLTWTPSGSRSAATSTTCGSSWDLNERTCQNRNPIGPGDKVEKGQIIATAPPPIKASGLGATCWCPSWPGTAFNFEDASSSRKSW